MHGSRLCDKVRRELGGMANLHQPLPLLEVSNGSRRREQPSPNLWRRRQCSRTASSEHSRCDGCRRHVTAPQGP